MICLNMAGIVMNMIRFVIVCDLISPEFDLICPKYYSTCTKCDWIFTNIFEVALNMTV